MGLYISSFDQAKSTCEKNFENFFHARKLQKTTYVFLNYGILPDLLCNIMIAAAIS